VDRDAAASELVSTLLLVLVAVAIGSVVVVSVASTLSRSHPPSASFSLAPLDPGDASATLVMGDGEPLKLAQLRLTLLRANGSSSASVPQASWSTPNPVTLSPGERWSVPLSPPAGAGETVRAIVVDAQSNAILADVSQAAPGVATGLGNATLTANLSSSTLLADGVNQTLLTARVSASSGGLAVASVQADLSALLAAAGEAPRVVSLQDLGADGDAEGGDGVWSARLTAPVATPGGAYAIPVNATDASGAPAASATVTLTVVPQGAHVGMGGRVLVPTSANVSSLHLRNWSWDALYPARVTGDVAMLRVMGGNSSTWSAVLDFGTRLGQPCLTGVATWTNARETDYLPVGGCPFLATLDLDLLNLTGTGWSVSSGGPDPQSLYPAAAVNGTAILTVPFVGEDNTKASSSFVDSQGVFGFDVVVR